MNVEEFLRLMDALRYDTDLDETNPELRGMVTKIYPYIRKVYNMMVDAGVIDGGEINESHGMKKHNLPKDKFAAMRKGNRDAEKDMYGDGFKAKTKIHNAKGYDRKENKKVYFDEVDENVVKLNDDALKTIIKESLKEMLNTTDRDSFYEKDGKYFYQGTGSEESDERVKQMNDKAYSSHRKEFFKNDAGYDRRNKERGGFEDIPNNVKDWHLLIMSLRNLASRNGYEVPSYLDSDLERLKTKEGAASFIEYLYKNGFKKMK